MDYDFYGHPLFASITGPDTVATPEVQQLEQDLDKMDIMQPRGDQGTVEGAPGREEDGGAAAGGERTNEQYDEIVD